MKFEDKLEFYYTTKYAHKTSDDISEKFANSYTEVAKNFAKKNPKIVEGGITGGLLGAGSELLMPARTDQFGQPSTNLTEMAKRGLLGAGMGAAGGAIKQDVSKRLAKLAHEDFVKIGGALDFLRSIPAVQKSQLAGKAIQGASNIAGDVAGKGVLNTAGKYMAKSPTLGGAVLGAGAGAAGNFLSGSDHGVGSTLAGAGLGALGGKALLSGSIKRANPLLGQNFAQGARAEMRSVNNAARAARGPVNAQSLQSAPPLSNLVQNSGVKPVPQTITHSAPPLSTPTKPAEVDWSRPVKV